MKGKFFVCLVVLGMERKKSYECDVCQKKFSERGNWVKRYRIHTGGKLLKFPKVFRLVLKKQLDWFL